MSFIAEVIICVVLIACLFAIEWCLRSKRTYAARRAERAREILLLRSAGQDLECAKKFAAYKRDYWDKEDK